MKKGFICFMSYLFLVAAISGCTTISGTDSASAPNLEPSISTKFSDLPVPAGYKLLAEDSYIFQSGDMRTGILKYSGKANGDQVVNFYREQMPMCGWSLLNTFEYGSRLLNFDKDNESCVVNIDDKKRMIIISFGPKSQVPIKKANKPLK